MATPSTIAEREIPAAFADYQIGAAYDEMFRASNRPRSHYRSLFTKLQSLPSDELKRSKQEADLSFFNQGITFTVYGRKEGTERIFPHDLLPRIIPCAEWKSLKRA